MSMGNFPHIASMRDSDALIYKFSLLSVAESFNELICKDEVGVIDFNTFCHLGCVDMPNVPISGQKRNVNKRLYYDKKC